MKKTKAEIRKENKEKKKRFYAKRGITFNKTVRNRKITELLPGTKGEIFDGQNLLYENYKEPLKKIPKSKGYGYYGTIATTADDKLIQCHYCGNLFANLGLHLRKHKVKAEDYKVTFGLAIGTSLVSEELREKLSALAVKTFDGKIPEHLKEYNRKVSAGEIKSTNSKRKGWSLEKRNELGFCPEQVLEKIKEAATKLGHTPSEEEFYKFYSSRYLGSIRRQHGSYLKAVAKAKLVSAKELKEPTNEMLLDSLIAFKEQHGRIPMTSDFARGLLRPRAMYTRRFGSLNNARIEAGLNAVIPMPFGQILEMQPEEYLEYKAARV